MAHGMKQSKLLSGHLCFLLGTIAYIGCSNNSDQPTVYPVSGKVTFKGQPVEGASVVFVPSRPGGQAASGTSDASGKYKLTTYNAADGALPGKYNVKVFKYDKTGRDPSKSVQNLSDEEDQAIFKENVTGAATPPKNLLPKKYERETDSGLSHSVTDGPTTFDITIE
jgi:hypothetical protein